MDYENEKLNEFCTYIKNKKVAIIGIETNDIPLLEYFYDLGAKVTAFDKRQIDDIDKNIVEKLISLGFEFSFGENYLSKLNGFNIIFRSPNCIVDKPQILDELDRGAILTSEIELLIELFPR